MLLGKKTKRIESDSNCYLARLTVEDISSLKPLEDQVQLAFWGKDNYRRFLEEYPEYFGCKAVMLLKPDQQSLVGFFLARAIYDSLEILKLGVFPECQRQGIGTQLMETAYAEGIRRGCNRCFLEVRKSNQSAIQFYYNHNFRIAGTRLNYYTEPPEDAWIMERGL
jgi:tRNA threonylcarbamoyladenosine biosynthesis protein TsaB